MTSGRAVAPVAGAALLAPQPGERGLDDITPTRGDARRLPYPDATLDAVYLTAVLGEIPDQDAALRELARVLRPGGRLAVGSPLGYFALFLRPGGVP